MACNFGWNFDIFSKKKQTINNFLFFFFFLPTVSIAQMEKGDWFTDFQVSTDNSYSETMNTRTFSYTQNLRFRVG
jgi:hypothetical protein